ncbi:hypothetical protein [Spectribacter hydrogenoxidans]|uniref:Phage integrase family protein n=1 Tax=Spectribacter hydrogenoxidans TaxID=3075608 RepID=A0ABU3C2W7_9GAMM|nr:hypothetical protein [Salinisphaera sp. W335]MDT0635909.1 hypothetical protein [Salinisphaera sp. W335]
MTSALDRLDHALGGRCSRKSLVSALYVLRAPKNLTAITVAAGEFLKRAEEYSGLQVARELPDYRARLHTLSEIARLETDDAILKGTVIEGRQLPLRPYTGDSAICEALLIDSAGDSQQIQEFRQLGAWFIWQAQRMHFRFADELEYERYLLDDTTRLNTRQHGGRLYSALLAFRRLGDPASGDVLNRIVRELPMDLDDRSSLLLTAIVHLIKSKHPNRQREIRDFASSKLGCGSDELDRLMPIVAAALPDEIGRLLRTNWNTEVAVSGRHSRGGSVRGRRIDRPRVQYTRRLTQLFSRVQEDEIHAGSAIEIFAAPEEAEPETPWVEDDDPDDKVLAEPDITLFLADSTDLYRGFYAAKGAQHAQEYAQAQLRWARWTLSEEAIARVIERIATDDPGGDLAHEPWARLAVGLSLLTGRALSETANVLVTRSSTAPTDNRPIVVDLAAQSISVRAGTPKLSQSPTGLTLCHPHVSALTLRLPASWSALLDQVRVANYSAEGKPQSGALARAARSLLRSLEPHLQVTETGLRFALVRALAEETRGDLGALGVITDGGEANSDNIVHYASYDARWLAQQWHRAASRLVGELPSPEALATAGRVGAIHAFNVEKLAAYVADIRDRQLQARERGEPIRAFNLATLYLSLWLNLAVAGRKSRSPVPTLILDDGWALVTDKSRADGSTDRLVPLTDSLREQLESYLALASELSLTCPELDPLVSTEFGIEVRLQYVRANGEVVPYQPKFQEAHEDLDALPANWGRKLVRSESGHLPGRYRDAGLGHWVRGRHPLGEISSLNCRQFRGAWLALQADLEHRLGFSVVPCLEPPTVRRPRPVRPATATGSRRPAPTAPKAPSLLPDQEVERLFREESDATFQSLMDTQYDCDPGRAMELVRRVTNRDPRRPLEERLILAESACTYLRKKRKVPLFAMRPRRMFSSRTVLVAGAMRTYLYCRQVVLPALHKDLAYLPPRGQIGERRGLMRPQDIRSVDLGRLVMIAIWRLGLAQWPLIEAWLIALATGQSILGTGAVRYMILDTVYRPTREPMRRTVFLDDFTTALLVGERPYIGELALEWKQGHGKQPPNALQRRSKAQAAMNRYLKFVCADQEKIRLTAMAQAAVQHIMLHSSPVVAGYAAGDFFSQDLDDSELRRLGGLAPYRAKAGQARVLATRENDVEDGDVPPDVARQGADVISAMVRHRGSHVEQWERWIRQHESKSPAERLIQAFAHWLLRRTTERASETSRKTSGGRFNTRAQRYYKNRIKVVSHAIFGFAEDSPEWSYIDESTLEALAELSLPHFPERLHHGAWVQFHRYLKDEYADHAGYEIGDLGLPRDRAVSAKLISPDNLTRLKALLPSARSGLTNPAWRIAAQRHVDLIATYGLRRAESEHLRAKDVQGDLTRVQHYDEHRLKTANSNRVLPLCFAPERVQEWIAEAHASGQGRLIDPGTDVTVAGHNFFAALNDCIKAACDGDDSMGSHHFRHTLASRLTLTLLRDAVDLPALYGDMPWLEPMLLDDRQIELLMGAEGDCGQGMRAVSALLGHSHPTTTIRHYVHVFGLLLHAAMRSHDPLDITRSFERRFASRATVQRWAQKARTTGGEPSRTIRDCVESWADGGVDLDERTLEATSGQSPAERSASGARTIAFDLLEAVDQSLRGGVELVDSDILSAARKGLEGLRAVPSGKKGSDLPRHSVLSPAGPGATPLPPPLRARTASAAAEEVCLWLAYLQRHRPVDLSWILDKWAYATDAKFGHMRLDSPEEEERASGIPGTDRLSIVFEEAGSSRRKTLVRRTHKQFARIRVSSIVKGRPTERGRTRGAIRWAMSHAVALRGEFGA